MNSFQTDGDEHDVMNTVCEKLLVCLEAFHALEMRMVPIMNRFRARTIFKCQTPGSAAHRRYMRRVEKFGNK